MNILIAPNAFKESLTASDAAKAIAAGVRAVAPEASLRLAPISDGGDGLLTALAPTLDATMMLTQARDPLGRPRSAQWAFNEETGTALIEMAEASGLALVEPEDRNALAASSHGTGDLIGAALDLGARRILLGIGGSATTDGGTGMAEALGARFISEAGGLVEMSGEALGLVRAVDVTGLDPRLSGVRIDVLCDVDNPLLGPSGAAHVYGPQKGAGPTEVEVLESGLANLANVIERSLGLDVRSLAGGGAAGGMGAGMVAFLRAHLVPGAEAVFDILPIEEALEWADLVLTGEGRFDEQTMRGKGPAAIARKAQEGSVPCIGFGGAVYPLDWSAAGFLAVHSITPAGMPLALALAEAEALLQSAASRAVQAYLRGT